MIYGKIEILINGGTLIRLNRSTILVPTPPHNLNDPIHPTSDYLFRQDRFQIFEY